MLSTVTVSSANWNANVSTGPNRVISTNHAAQGTATMVTVAAVELDQVNSRIMG